MPDPGLAIVIVNYRTGPLTIECLASLAPQVMGRSRRVLVADNASPDGSGELIAKAIAQRDWSAWAEFLPLDRNGGFAWGNNQAITKALAAPKPPDYILLLNPDTVVRPGALDALIAFMEEHPTAAVAGSRLEGPDGSPQVSAFRFPTILSELESGLRLGVVTKLLRRRVVSRPVSAESHETDWVSGASFMVRRSVMDTIGLLDDGYFMYYEELDFCLRARRAGRTCHYVPASRVVHLVGQSSGGAPGGQAARRLPSWWFESRRRYFVKNHGRIYAAAADATWAACYATWRLRRALQRKPDHDPPHQLRDFIHHSVLLRKGRT